MRKDRIRALRDGLNILVDILEHPDILNVEYGKELKGETSLPVPGGDMDDGHVHDYYIDEEGNGVTSFVNGHLHLIRGNRVHMWYRHENGEIVGHRHVLSKDEYELIEEIKKQ